MWRPNIQKKDDEERMADYFWSDHLVLAETKFCHLVMIMSKLGVIFACADVRLCCVPILCVFQPLT